MSDGIIGGSWHSIAQRPNDPTTRLFTMRLGFIKTIFQKVDTLVTGRGRIDEELFEDLEAALLQADVNVHTTMKSLDDLREAVKENRLKEAEDVKSFLQRDLAEVLHRADVQGGKLRIGPSAP